MTRSLAVAFLPFFLIPKINISKIFIEKECLKHSQIFKSIQG
jgi:hypothetical protein